MADFNYGYLAVPIEVVTSSKVISAQKGEHYVILDAEAGIMEISISGSEKFKYTFVNVNAEYTVNFSINGETAVLGQYDSIIIHKPLDSSGALYIMNPTIGIS